MNESEESVSITGFPGNGRTMPVEGIEEVQELVVNVYVSSQFSVTPPPRCLGSSSTTLTMSFGFNVFCSFTTG